MIDIQLNKIIHEQVRLKILVILASSKAEWISFTELKKELGLSAGNLSIQLKTLEEAGFIKTEKLFADNKPRTDVQVTPAGRSALVIYMTDLEKILGSIR